MQTIFDNLDNFANVNTLIIKDLFYFHNVRKSISFHIIHLNIRSTNKNVSEFLIMMSTALNLLDFIVLIEAWLLNNIVSYKIENFNAIKTNDNLFNQNSGIIVFINKKYQINEFTEFAIDICNYLHLKIGNCIKYKVIALYRSPCNNFNDFISTFKQHVSKMKSNN